MKFNKKILLVLLLLLLPLAFAACGKKSCGNRGGADETKCSVNFIDADGNCLYVASVDKGGVPEYLGEAPEKAATESEVYTFTGWKAGDAVYTELPAIMQNTVFYAQFESAAREYSISFFVNGKETSATYKYGETPEYDGLTQWVEDSVRYTIVSWSEPFAPVKGDKKYTAEVVTDGVVKVTFEADGNMLQFDTVLNERPVFYGEPYKRATDISSFEFAGWRDGDNFYARGVALPPAVRDVTYTAEFTEVYKTFSVRFKDGANTLHETKAQYGAIPGYGGEVPEKEGTFRAQYIFEGWETEDGKLYKELPEVKCDTVYYAVFKEQLKAYSLTISYFKGNEKISEYKSSYVWGDNCRVETPLVAGYVADIPYVAITVTDNMQVNVTYKPAVVWDGASAAFGGDGTENNPYLIESGANLSYLSESVRGGNSYEGKIIKLAADIDLADISWTAIGTNQKPFAGIFDGGGHIITGLNLEDHSSNTVANSGHGLFSTIKGTVKNLSVSGSVFADARYSAMIVGNSTGGTVENCKAYGIVYGYGNSGGIVGLNSGNITDCINYAEIRDNGSATSYRFGGVAGTITAGKVEGCTNYGAVVIEHATDQVGGIVGRSEGAAVVGSCTNYGYVNFKKNYTGGVIGYTSGTASQKHYDLTNYAPVYGIGNVGGIAGYTGVTLENCQNFGYVYGSAARVGGVVGFVNLNGTRIDGCQNYGDVYGAAQQVGGVVGCCGTSPVVTMSECVNRGSVKGAYHVGGIVGDTYTMTVENCQNFGDVSVSTREITNTNIGFAGISGWTTTNSTVTGCTNYGNVNAYTNVGGIAGYLGAGSSVTHCRNEARIKGVTAFNSLIGLNNNK